MTPEEQVLLGPGATPVNPAAPQPTPTLNYTPAINYTPVSPTSSQGVISNQSTPPAPTGQILGSTTTAPNASIGTPNVVVPPPQNPSPTSQDTGTVNIGNLLSKFPGYAGWDINSAWQDYLNTGGSGKGVSTDSGGYTSPEGVTYGSQEEYNRLIDEAYNPQIDSLNEQANNLNLGQTSALEQAQTAFNTQQSLASGQLGTAQSQLGEIGVKGQSAYESALAQARSVYDQLQRGYQQRFGGSSSAGQAATEIGNVERLKQQGQSYKQLQDVNRQVEMGKQEAQKTYDQNILQLQQNKDKAIADVQADFRDKLAQINASRGMVESAKAQAKLQALQGLRQQVLQVQQQETSFRQQLEMQKQQNQMALDTYAKQLAMQNQSTGTNTASTINALGQKITAPNAQVQYAASGVNPGYQYTPTGQIGKKYDYATQSWI